MRKYRSIMIGIILGLAVVMLINGLGSRYNLRRSQIFLILVLIAVILFIIGFIINYRKLKKYNDRVKYQVELLNNHKASEALKDMQDLVEELDSKNLTNISRFIKLNMTAAYAELRQYDKSLELLLSLKDEKLSVEEELIYKLNLTVSYYYLNRTNEAISTYEENKELFEQYSENPNYEANIAAVKIMILIAKGNYQEARRILEKAKGSFNNPRLQADYVNFDMYLRQFENR